MKLAALTDKFREIYNSYKDATQYADALKLKQNQLESETMTLKETNSVLVQALAMAEKKLVASPLGSPKLSHKPQDRSNNASLNTNENEKGTISTLQAQIQLLIDEKDAKDDEARLLSARLWFSEHSFPCAWDVVICDSFSD